MIAEEVQLTESNISLNQGRLNPIRGLHLNLKADIFYFVLLFRLLNTGYLEHLQVLFLRQIIEIILE